MVLREPEKKAPPESGPPPLALSSTAQCSLYAKSTFLTRPVDIPQRQNWKSTILKWGILVGRHLKMSDSEVTAVATIQSVAHHSIYYRLMQPNAFHWVGSRLWIFFCQLNCTVANFCTFLCILPTNSYLLGIRHIMWQIRMMSVRLCLRFVIVFSAHPPYARHYGTNRCAWFTQHSQETFKSSDSLRVWCTNFSITSWLGRNLCKASLAFEAAVQCSGATRVSDSLGLFGLSVGRSVGVPQRQRASASGSFYRWPAKEGGRGERGGLDWS